MLTCLALAVLALTTLFNVKDSAPPHDRRASAASGSNADVM
jgi:hypothetical protein